MEERELGLELLDLRIGYGGESLKLNPLNARVAPGELVALIGRNGVGKSTLLRTIAGEIPPCEGGVVLNGMGVWGMSLRQRAKQLAFAPSSLGADGDLVVRDAVRMARYPHRGWLSRWAAEDAERVEKALGEAGVAALASRRVGELSDGERQRVSLAMLLAQGSSVLVLDEPSAHLDVVARAEVAKTLRGVAHGTGRAVLYSTHDLDAAMGFADRLWVLDGEGLSVCTPGEALGTGLFARAFGQEWARLWRAQWRGEA